MCEKASRGCRGSIFVVSWVGLIAGGGLRRAAIKNGNGSGSDRVESPCTQNRNPKSKPEPETDSGGNPSPKPNPRIPETRMDTRNPRINTHIHMYKQEATNNKYFHDSTFNKFNNLSKQIIINIL